MGRLASLAERQARYERIVELRDQGIPLAGIGAQLNPPLTRERVRQIIRLGPPRSAGRTPSDEYRDPIRRRVKYWEEQVRSRTAQRLDASYATKRLLANRLALAALDDASEGVTADR